MAIVKILSSLDKKEWEDVIHKLGDDTYYKYTYYKLYENYGDGEMFFFVYNDTDNLIGYPFLKNKITHLEGDFYDIEGCYGYNGLLSTTDDVEILADFYKEFKEYCKKENIVAEFTRFNPLTNNYKLSENYFNILFDRKTVCIEVDNQEYESFYKKFSTSCKRAIKKAIKEGVTVKVKEKPRQEDLLLFFEIYTENMRRVNATDYLMFNEEYFLSMQNLEDVVIYYACIKDTVIGAFLCFLNKEYAHYHLGASRTEYLGLRPNNFLYNEFIKRSIDKKVSIIHFGGGRTTLEDDSLLKFKLMYSKNTKYFYIGKKIHNEDKYKETIQNWENKYPELVGTSNNLLRYKITTNNENE